MPFIYIVQKGDTLFRIARRHAINLESLLAANPELTDPDMIAPGLVIRIPDRPINRYVIQAGDTFAYIAKRFRLSLSDLQASNPEADPRRLKIGQQIVLPPASDRERSIVRPDMPYGYPELAADLERLVRKYPFLEVCSIGNSVMGKPIWAVRIGSGPNEWHLNAAMHANEWITALTAMKFLEDYAEAVAGGRPFRGYSAAELAKRTTLWAVPLVNPDGVELVLESVSPQHPYYERLLEWNNGSFQFAHWKANVRGVDLNDQFPAHWEEERARRQVEGPAPRDYTGEAPLSEPEAAALVRFTRCRDFRFVVALHTQGEEIYWNYRELEPAEAEELAQRLAEASGYRSVKLTGSDAGYKDWFIQEYRRPGFTVELGCGVNPLPLRQFPVLYDRAAGLLVACLGYASQL